MIRNILSIAFACMLAFAPECSAEGFGELYYQRASLFKELGTDSASIVFLGNSLSHGCEWHELFDNHHVVGRGINGDTAEGIAARLSDVTTGQPAKIFLMCGANDISHNLTPDSIAQSVAAIVDRIKVESPSTRIYLQSMLPINNSFGRYKLMAGKEDDIRTVNVLLEQIAQQRGIRWVNLYPLFCDNEQNLRHDLTNDGLHLLAPGYVIWRDAVKALVDE